MAQIEELREIEEIREPTGNTDSPSRKVTAVKSENKSVKKSDKKSEFKLEADEDDYEKDSFVPDEEGAKGEAQVGQEEEGHKDQPAEEERSEAHAKS